MGSTVHAVLFKKQKSKEEDRKTEKIKVDLYGSISLIVKNECCNYKSNLELICILHGVKEPRYQVQ